jgi:DNA-binding NarL/FixJ family response regulator
VAAAWAAGRALPLDEAVAEALTVDPTSEGAPQRPAPVVPHGLTPRELEVLRLVAAGRSDREVAEALFVSPRTVGAHVSHLLTKLGVDNRAAAAALASREGLV